MKKILPRKHFFLALLLILTLIALDQGTKLAVDHLIGRDESLMQVTNTVHLHPYLNDEDSVAMQPIADESGIPLEVLLLLDSLKTTLSVALAFLLACAADRFIFWDIPRKSYPKLTILLICLMISAIICSGYIDELGWGGSLDFLCIARDTEMIRTVGNHTHTVIAPHHKIFDLKDLYIAAAFPLIIARCLLWYASFFKLLTDKEERTKLDHKFKHPIENIRRMRAARKGNSTSPRKELS